LKLLLRSVSGLLLALGTTLVPAVADADMTLIYSRYHMAIRAAILCRELHPDAETWRRWASYIDAKTEHELGAGERLTTIEGAKTDTRIMVRSRGCASDDVTYLLKIFDAELAGL
jgi:hypothetical protein